MSGMLWGLVIYLTIGQVIAKIWNIYVNGNEPFSGPGYMWLISKIIQSICWPILAFGLFVDLVVFGHWKE